MAADMSQQHASGKELFPADLALMIPILVSRFMGQFMHIQIRLGSKGLSTDVARYSRKSIPMFFLSMISQHEIVDESSSTMLANKVKLFFVILHVNFHIFRVARCIQAKGALFFFVIMHFHVNPQCPFVVKHFITFRTRNVSFLSGPMIPGNMPQLVFPLIKLFPTDLAFKAFFVNFDMHIKTPPALKLLIALATLHT